MTDLYRANIALLKQFHPHTWESIAKSPPKTAYGEIITAAKGKPNLKITHKGHEVFLHAEHDPTLEISQFLDLVPENSTEIVVMLGMGLGYTPLALLEQRPDISCLIIFELVPEIFIQALHNMDLSPILLDERLILNVSARPDVPKAFAQARHALQYEAVIFLKHLPSLSLKEEEYRILDEQIYNFTNEISNIGATKSIHGETLMANRFANLTAIRHHFLLENLKNIYTNIPAFIVAAGPSLDKNIHLLKEAQDKAVIIAVDSSLPSLLFHGIEPHFITVIDFSHFTYEKIADSGPRTHNASLLYTPGVGPKSPKTFPAKNFFCAPTDNPFEKWIYSELGGKDSAADIATVAHLNLTSAITMGCDPIIFVGQDLSYPPAEHKGNHVDHAKHCFFGHSSEVYLTQDTLWVKGIDGKMRPTLRDFLAYIKMFERIMAATPRHYINATAAGAHLAGTEILAIEEAIRLFCQKQYNINELLEERLEQTPHPDVNNLLAALERKLGEIQTLKKEINTLIPLAKKFSKQILQLNSNDRKPKCFDDLPVALQKKAHDLDTIRDKIDRANFFWQVLDELTMKDFRKNTKKMQEINKLQKNPEKYIELVSKNSEFILRATKIRQKALNLFEKKISQLLDHLQKEKKLLFRATAKGHNRENLLKLASFYFSSRDFASAQPFLEKLYRQNSEDAEVCFSLGCIAAHQTEHARAEQLFSHSESLDTTFKKRLSKFRQQYGDEYWNIAEELIKEINRPSKKLLFRGITHCPDHKKIRNELGLLARKDQKAIQEKLDSGELDKAKTIISEWLDALGKNANLPHCLGPESAAFYLQNGHMLCLEKRYEEAEKNFQKALLLTPDNPEIHMACVNLCFIKNDFAGGVASLHKAIDLDSKYAIFWQNIGESLLQAGQYNEALYSYEQAFLAFPDKIELLKKIGDCYLAGGQLDAAKEAYQQVKIKLGA